MEVTVFCMLCQYKEKDFGIKEYSLCLDNFWKDFNLKKKLD